MTQCPVPYGGYSEAEMGYIVLSLYGSLEMVAVRVKDFNIPWT